MLRKELGLLLLILVVGAVVAVLNPRFLSPINLSNTANLIGLFGLFSLAQAFVIISGGIELSVGSIIALLGVVFVDLIANIGVPWGVALPVVVGLSDSIAERARRRSLCGASTTTLVLVGSWMVVIWP